MGKLRLSVTVVALMLAIAWLVPATRWYTEYEVATVIGVASRLPALFSPNDADAARYPHEFDIQLCAAIALDHPIQSDVGMTEANQAIPCPNTRALAARFPNQPALYANLLRLEVAGIDLRDARLDDDRFLAPATDSIHTTTQRKPTPPSDAYWNAFMADAANGERIEPSNAFFPTMAAIGYLARHSDAEAKAALDRAARKPVWSEYCSVPATGQIDLDAHRFGTTPGISAVAVYAATLLPQYSAIREMARAVTATAARDEIAGDAKDGLDLRLDLIRLGGLMRTQGQTLIGNMVGMALDGIAVDRPGGAPAVRHPHGESRQAATRRILASMSAYLDKAGIPAAYPAIEAELDASLVAHNAISRYLSRVDDLRYVIIPGVLFMAALVLLLSLAWVLAMSILAQVASSGEIVAAGVPLGMALGFGCGMVVGLAIAAATMPLEVLPAAFCLGLIGVLIAAPKLAMVAQPFQRLLVASLAGAVVVVVSGFILYHQASSPFGGQFVPTIETAGDNSTTEMILISLCAASLSVIAALIWSITAAVKRQPISGYLAQRFATLGSRIVLAASVCWIVVTMAMAIYDTNLRQICRQCWGGNEAQYYASTVGPAWPGGTDWSSLPPEFK